jgi:hypothetical protein
MKEFEKVREESETVSRSQRYLFEAELRVKVDGRIYHYPSTTSHQRTSTISRWLKISISQKHHVSYTERNHPITR